MEENKLADFYNQLKSKLAEEDGPAPRTIGSQIPPEHDVHGDRFHHMMMKQRDKLQDGCFKHILLDMYCKILPLDKDYVAGHMGQMSSDVDCMLKAKGMTPTQYITSASKGVGGSKLLEFVIKSVNNACQQFVEDATAEVADKQARGMDVPIPEAPADPTSDPDVNHQLVDVTKDSQYTDFIETLKKKTINKIVSDVSKIITDKKEDSSMAFNTKPIADLKEETETTTSIGLDYLQAKLMQENIDTSSMTEALLGMAIRESTLHQFDVVFRQPGMSFQEFASAIRYNRGMIINEAAVQQIASKAKSGEDVDKIVKDANDKCDKEIDSKLKASEVVKAKKDNED